MWVASCPGRRFVSTVAGPSSRGLTKVVGLRQKVMDAVDDVTSRSKVSRRLRERSDSVTEDMLQERAAHMERLTDIEPRPEVVALIRQLGLGRRKQARDSTKFFKGDPTQRTEIGGLGFAKFLASAAKNWPMFKHMLPEVALAGHSNCGKSSLVNALCGLPRSKGVARVSDRAGWTDAIYFYSVGKKPPVLTLADLPGYGHAVASIQQRRQWREMTKAYILERKVLTRCCVLVDCLIGLCKEDKEFLDRLDRKGIPYQVVLTKGDLLNEEDLAKSHEAVSADLAEAFPRSHTEVAMVSSFTGAGIDRLFKKLVVLAEANAVKTSETAVGIHKNALI